MFKKIICLLLINSFVSFSQETVGSIPLILKKNEGVFEVVNNNTKTVNLFITNKKYIKSILLDEKFGVKDSIVKEIPNSKTYKEIIGNISTKDFTRLFWSSKDNEQILSQSFDFKNPNLPNKEFLLNLEDQKIINIFSENETFYILTIFKYSNTFKIHVFNKNNEYEEKTIALPDDFVILNSDYSKNNLYGILKENFLNGNDFPFVVQKIDPTTPNSLVESSKKRKLYFEDNKIILTLDTNPDYTQIINIDLEKNSVSEKTISQVTYQASETDDVFNSNSFYLNHKLYQIKTSRNLFHFTIKDLDNNLLKEYFADETHEIKFKNPNIDEQEEVLEPKKILKKTTQFIRQTNNMNAGISCYQNDQNNRITIGAITSIQATTGQMVGMQFGLVGALISAAAFRPAMSFNPYANRGLAKIDGIFDSTGNHIEGKLSPLAIDKIRTFADASKAQTHHIIFKLNTAFYLGCFEKETNQYVFRKFMD